MKTQKTVLSFALVAMVFSYTVKPVYAASEPSFPSCLNPQGTLKVKYESGTHGIVGDRGNYQGQDEVYTISDNSLVQCFCPDNGSGIQTNWWKTENFDVDQIKNYQNQGWILVPDGSIWGLSGDQYLAKNSTYACHGGTGGGVLGIGQVLALASTGNIIFIYATALLGISLIAAGIMSQRRNNKRS